MVGRSILLPLRCCWQAVIRQQALTGLLHEGEAAVRVLLAEIVNCIIIYDYPNEWPGVLGRSDTARQTH